MVVLYHNIMAPYRDALFREIAKRINLTVWFSARTTRDRDWGSRDPVGYPFRVLDARVWYGFNRPLMVTRSLSDDLESAKPDVVIAVLTRSNAIDVIRIMVTAKRLRTPVILWIGNVEYPSCYQDELPGLVTGAFELYYRFAVRRASGFMYYSRLSEDWAIARGASGPSMCGTQVLEPPPVEPRLEERTDGPIRLLFVGKLERRKGIDLLVSGLNSLDAEERAGLELVVAGKGELERALADHAQFPIRFLGHVSRSQLWDVYKDSDLLVLPSRHDPWGFVVNEAMAMGTPVIASSACGAAELARLAGWTFDPCKPGDLAGVLSLAISRARERGIRRRALQATGQYSVEECSIRVAELIHRLVDAGLR